MNIFQLKCFLAVANTLSFAKAAEQLNVSQPTVTHQIKTLENELNVKLFRRSTRFVAITPEGQSFILDAKSMVIISDRARMRFSIPEEHPVSRLSIGCSSLTELLLLTDIIKTMNAELTNFHPRLQAAPPDRLLHLLETEQVDVVFSIKNLESDRPHIHYRELMKTSIVAVCHKDNPLALRSNLTINDLLGESLIFCDPINIAADITKIQFRLAETQSPKNIHFCGSIDIAITLALSGIGTAFLPDIYISGHPTLTNIPITDAPSICLGMYYKSFPGDTMLKKFLKLTAEHFQGITG